MAGWYELKKASDGQFYFNLKASNGEIILTSEMYKAKASAANGIASVQKNSSDDGRYNREESSSGKWYFTLKAGNHEVIGRSQMYASAASRDGGIDSVKRNGPATDVREVE